MSVALRRAWAKDLDTATLYELLKLRVEVFVVEQATPYPELDGRLNGFAQRGLAHAPWAIENLFPGS